MREPAFCEAQWTDELCSVVLSLSSLDVQFKSLRAMLFIFALSLAIAKPLIEF